MMCYHWSICKYMYKISFMFWRKGHSLIGRIRFVVKR